MMLLSANHLDRNDVTVPASEPPPFQGTRAHLRVQIEPLTHRCYGKVFNDLHSETIGYHVIPHRPYHSYIESAHFRLETDQIGYPVYVSVGGWREIALEAPLAPPNGFELGMPRFLDVRIHCPAPRVEYDADNSLIHIVFNDSPECRHWALEPHAIWSIDNHGILAALWLRDIMLDPTGKRFLKWRRRAWSCVRRDYRAGRLAIPEMPTPLSASSEKSSGL
ncbi:MAG: hypothetical protein Kow0074_10750 [Candidatus Zixiibacteriota bacterium]